MPKRNAKTGSPATVSDQRGRESAPARPETFITYVVNRNLINEYFDLIAAGLQPCGHFFRQLGQLVHVDSAHGGMVLVDQHTFNGFVSSQLEIRHMLETADGVKLKGFRLLNANHIAAFIKSPRVLAQFPELSHFTQSPLFDRNWNLISTPGYDATSGVYYAGPSIEPATGTAVLDRMLSEFCWKSAIDRVNYVGMLLTVVTILHWIGKHPLAVFNANQPGLGKTLLALLLGLIFDGAARTVTYNANDEEFEKQLATCVERGDRTIIVDNAKSGRGGGWGPKRREIDSPVLERSLTDTELHYRRLGSNTAIRRPNDVIFALTMNRAKLSQDLRRRSVPINLEFVGRIRDRDFSIAQLEDFVIAHRAEIQAEIVGMVSRWRDDGCPLPSRPARHSMSQTWAATIDAILRASGLTGFLENFESSEHAYDPDYEDMEEVCAECHDDPPATPAQWAERLHDCALLKDRLLGEDGSAKGAHAQATIVGTLFAKFTGIAFDVAAGGFRLACTSKGRSHDSIAYWFEPVQDGPASSIDERKEGTSEP